jgi:hypothetical protein
MVAIEPDMIPLTDQDFLPGINIATQKQWQCKVVQDKNDMLYEHVYTSEAAAFKNSCSSAHAFC